MLSTGTYDIPAFVSCVYPKNMAVFLAGFLKTWLSFLTQLCYNRSASFRSAFWLTLISAHFVSHHVLSSSLSVCISIQNQWNQFYCLEALFHWLHATTKMRCLQLCNTMIVSKAQKTALF